MLAEPSPEKRDKKVEYHHQPDPNRKFSLLFFSLYLVMQMADVGMSTVSEANDLAGAIESGCHILPEKVEGQRCNLAEWFAAKPPGGGGGGGGGLLDIFD